MRMFKFCPSNFFCRSNHVCTYQLYLSSQQELMLTVFPHMLGVPCITVSAPSAGYYALSEHRTLPAMMMSVLAFKIFSALIYHLYS